MSIELCQSSTSSSLICANTPRLDASLMNCGSRACSNTITGHAASRTILSIKSNACAELSPNPTSATSGRSLAVTGPTSATSISRAITSCPKPDHDRRRPAPNDPYARWRSAHEDARSREIPSATPLRRSLFLGGPTRIVAGRPVCAEGLTRRRVTRAGPSGRDNSEHPQDESARPPTDHAPPQPEPPSTTAGHRGRRGRPGHTGRM